MPTSDRKYRKKSPLYYFSLEESSELNGLLKAMAADDKIAAQRFHSIISPWMDDITANMANKLFRDATAWDEEKIRETKSRTYDLLLMRIVKRNRIFDWREYSISFRTTLNDYLQVVRNAQEREHFAQSDADTPRFSPPHERTFLTEEEAALIENEITGKIPKVLNKIEQRILDRRLKGHPFSEIAKKEKPPTSEEEVTRIYENALHKLRSPSTAIPTPHLTEWAEENYHQGKAGEWQRKAYIKEARNFLRQFLADETGQVSPSMDESFNKLIVTDYPISLEEIRTFLSNTNDSKLRQILAIYKKPSIIIDTCVDKINAIRADVKNLKLFERQGTLR